MATEYKLSYTAQEINTKLGKIDNLATKSEVPTKTSDLTNDSGYITDYAETDPTVPSWAKASTKPSYTKSEVGLGNVDNVKQYSASNPPPYPVTKVNNKTGAITLSASDVGADVTGTASSAVSAHNTNTSAHADIREQINQLSSEKVDKTEVSLGIASDGLIYIFVDGKPVGTGIPQGQSGDVFGYVDENNNIILTGALPDGSYNIKYEMEDGSTVDIGDLVLDTNIYYSITNTLTNCTNSNSAISIVEGESYSATITANDGYELSSVVVTMGGAAVPVTNGVINIASVTGNIVITAVAEEMSVEIVNQIPLSTDTDGTIYNGIGYKTDTRINSSGAAVAASGVTATGFIPAKTGDTVYIKGFIISDNGLSKIQLYDASKSSLGLVGTSQFVDGGDGTYSHTITVANVAYIRAASEHLMDGSEILTINQPIDVGAEDGGTETEPEEIVNLFDATSSDAGYGRLGSDGSIRTDAPNNFVTNYIAVENGDVVRVSGCDVCSYYSMAGYDSFKAKVFSQMADSTQSYFILDNCTENYAQLTLTSDTVKFLRFTCSNPNGSTSLVDTSAIIITKNQPIS